MARVYLYVVDRDFGFAPNPFHGCCTLATCKAGIRQRAAVADWIVGVGGARLKATGRCIFGMRVTDTVSYSEYWTNPLYFDKRPVRSGSKTMMVGDNIYHFDAASGGWSQADSHHSNPNGSPNVHNVANDTKADRVLISQYFYYFGRAAPKIPKAILAGLDYRNGRNYRVYDESRCSPLLSWLERRFGHCVNLVLADPFNFVDSEKRYSVAGNRIQ